MTSGNRSHLSQKCIYLFLTAEQAGSKGTVTSQTQRQRLLGGERSLSFRQESVEHADQGPHISKVSFP